MRDRHNRNDFPGSDDLPRCHHDARAIFDAFFRAYPVFRSPQIRITYDKTRLRDR
jgi:hypothetical protein